MTTAITLLGRLRATLPYVVVLAAGLHLFYLAEGFEFEQSSGRIGPGAWPQIILVLMIVTALWGIVSSARRAVADVPELVAEEDEALIQPPEIYPWLVWLAVAMTLIYLFVLPIFGFFLTTAIYSFVLMYIGHYRKPASAAVLSLAIALSFMFIFMRVVYVALPLGIAPFIDVSYALMAAMGVR